MGLSKEVVGRLLKQKKIECYCLRGFRYRVGKGDDEYEMKIAVPGESLKIERDLFFEMEASNKVCLAVKENEPFAKDAKKRHELMLERTAKATA